MADQITRGAARWATLVAVPAALLAGLGTYALFGGNGGAPEPRPQATGPVDVPAPALDDRDASVCRTLVSRLPGAVRDRARRPVTTGSGQNAAYGDPPITVACGGPRASASGTDNVALLNRVCWHVVEQGRVTVWAAVDRAIPVRVTVPRAYEPPGQWVIDFSAPVAAAVPATTDPPGGCTGR